MSSDRRLEIEQQKRRIQEEHDYLIRLQQLEEREILVQERERNLEAREHIFRNNTMQTSNTTIQTSSPTTQQQKSERKRCNSTLYSFI